MNKVAYHEAAREELLHEVGYLELRTKGLGQRFFQEVRRIEDFIAEFPLSGKQILPGIRKRSLRKFRYALFYSFDEESGTLILAVAHHSRRPGYWVGRLRDSPEG